MLTANKERLFDITFQPSTVDERHANRQVRVSVDVTQQRARRQAATLNQPQRLSAMTGVDLELTQTHTVELLSTRKLKRSITDAALYYFWIICIPQLLMKSAEFKFSFCAQFLSLHKILPVANF